MVRNNTHIIKIGNVSVGGNNTIVIQSMTNTKTSNINQTISQIKSLAACGCEIIRCAITDDADAKAIAEIKKEIAIPLVADIHFDYRLALLSIEYGADKIRINPGNIGLKNFEKVIIKCQKKNIPIRIGVNAGSLDKKYANSNDIAAAMCQSLLEYIRFAEELSFTNLVLSLKSSDVITTIKAYEKVSTLVQYPLHIGITESGTLLTGSIRSSVGLGVLLYNGIGNTIRVSLTGDPLNEINVAQEILASVNLFSKATLISCPTCGRLQYNMNHVAQEIDSFLKTIDTPIKVAIMGCAVNGPGEAANADIGIAGGKNEVLLFKKGAIIRKLRDSEIIDVLKKEITELAKNKNNN